MTKQSSPSIEALRQRWNNRYQDGTHAVGHGHHTAGGCRLRARCCRAQGGRLTLDLGTGTNVHYLARLGLTAVGVELAGPRWCAHARRAQVDAEVRPHGVCAGGCEHAPLPPGWARPIFSTSAASTPCTRTGAMPTRPR
ncbi:MAG: hypothetical protein R2838_17565 [Caldilineaceae bacterium]